MSTVECPTCKRKLRVPEGLSAQPVRCPACATTFEASSEVVPAIDLTGAAALITEAYSDQPRPASAPAAPPPEPDPDQAATARRGRFLGGWPLVRSGLGWIMADQFIELGVLGLNLLVIIAVAADLLTQGGPFDLFLYPFFDRDCVGGCWRGTAYLVGGICMLVGLARCQRSYPAPGPARGVATAALVAFSFAYFFRMACSPFLFWGIYDIPFAEGTWLVGIGRLTRWVAESLLLLYLMYLGRDWRDEPTLARLRWLLALLVADVLLHLSLFAGLFEKWLDLTSSLFPFPAGPFHLGIVFQGGLVILQLVTSVQLLRVLVAARRALAGQAATRDPDLELG